MSYDIIYDKLSVDMGDGLFMPVMLQGCNRSYELGSRRRARNWVVWSGVNRKVWQSKADWENDCDRSATLQGGDPDDICQGFGVSIQGTKNTYLNYKGLFVAATEKSVTFDELVEKYGAEFRVDIDENGDWKLVKSKIEFMSLVTDYINFYNHCPGITMIAGDDTAKRMRRELYPSKTRQKEAVDVDFFYTIDTGCRCYFIKLTPKGVKYTGLSGHAKQFLTEQDATKEIERIQRKRNIPSLSVQRIDSATTFYI